MPREPSPVVMFLLCLCGAGSIPVGTGCAPARSAALTQPVAVPQPAPAVAELDPDIQQALNTVDSERVYKTARPGPDVPVLTIVGATEQRIRPDQVAQLAVRSAPRSLVTSWTRDGGLFPNQRASITVLSDDQGMARTTLTINPGTIDDVSVIVGGQKSVGTVALMVHVLHPGSPFNGQNTP